MIRRLLPEMTARQSPLSAFSLLLIGQGFSSQAEFTALVKQAFWARLVATPPFEALDGPAASNRMFIFYDPCEELDLQLVQNGSQLLIPAAARSALTDFLQAHTVHSDNGEHVNGNHVWPPTVRSGRSGSLVAAVLKGTVSGELYRLDASDDYPTPLVGTVAAGDDWMMTIIRAIGSLYAGLGDEYSLPDTTSLDGAVISYDKFPHSYLAPFPNLIAYTDEQRDQLAAGKSPTLTLGCLPHAFWVGGDVSKLSFVPYPQDQNSPATGINLYEGAVGYRHNIARGYRDCLMRRQPLRTGPDAVQAPIGFCNVCRAAIAGAMRGDPDFDLSRASRITIDKQKTVYDMVNWGDTVKTSTGKLAVTPLAGAKNGKPRWSFTVAADASGITISQLQLLDRDLGEYPDPFAAAVNVAQQITFGDLSVTWAGDSSPTPLSFAEAFSSAVPPTVEIAGPDPGGFYQNGVKVTLTWDNPDKRPVQAAFTFVTRGQKNDFDPGGAAVACKFYPQIAMRVLPPLKRSGKTRPQATSLRGSITVVCNNVIPASVRPPQLENFGTGTIQGSFFADSNSTLFDGVYTPSKATAASAGSAFFAIPPPYFGLWNFSHQSGRLLASVGSAYGVELAGRQQIAGSTALYGYRYKSGPLLPFWSWLFDYAAPALDQQKELQAATYANDETTLDSGHRGDFPRQTGIEWPPDLTYAMTIRKEGRQGQYDNIHIHASMPPMPGMAMNLIPAPFCADMCVHLHWRWGIDAVSSMAAPYAFYGWGWDGRGRQGAHSCPGAPLIPPNQHLRVVGTPAEDQSTFTLTYDVTAVSPKINAWQVFMEQGMAIAYRYAIDGLSDFCSPLSATTFPLLLVALGVLDPGIMAKDVATLESIRLLQLENAGLAATGQAVEMDAAIRLRFHDIYAQLRYFNKDRDNSDAEQIPTYNPGLEDF